MGTREIIIPDGWEINGVIGNKIILRDKEEEVLPKTWEECSNDVAISCYPQIGWYIPCNEDAAIKALCKLVICRDAWWKHLGWKPNWNHSDYKYCIFKNKGEIGRICSSYANRALAFPTEEVRDQFLETFRELIEEAKELL